MHALSKLQAEIVRKKCKNGIVILVLASCYSRTNRMACLFIKARRRRCGRVSPLENSSTMT